MGTDTFLGERYRRLAHRRGTTIAFFLPDPTVASPRTRARYRLPLPVPLLPFFRPTDSEIPGANWAHDARCAGVGNRVMSRPISAMIACAVVTPTPGISSSRVTVAAKGAICSSIRSCNNVDVRGDPIDPREHSAQQERVVIGEPAGERLLQACGLGPHPSAGHLRQDLRVAFPGDQRGHHVP